MGKVLRGHKRKKQYPLPRPTTRMAANWKYIFYIRGFVIWIIGLGLMF